MNQRNASDRQLELPLESNTLSDETMIGDREEDASVKELTLLKRIK